MNSNKAAQIHSKHKHPLIKLVFKMHLYIYITNSIVPSYTLYIYTYIYFLGYIHSFGIGSWHILQLELVSLVWYWPWLLLAKTTQPSWDIAVRITVRAVFCWCNRQGTEYIYIISIYSQDACVIVELEGAELYKCSSHCILRFWLATWAFREIVTKNSIAHGY